MAYLFDRAAFEITFLGLMGFYSSANPNAEVIDPDELRPGECMVIGESDEAFGHQSFIADHSLFQDAGESMVMARSSTGEWRATAPAMLERFLDDAGVVVEFGLAADPEGELEAISAEVVDGND